MQLVDILKDYTTWFYGDYELIHGGEARKINY